MNSEQTASVSRATNAALAKTEHGNLRTQMAIEHFFDNFDRIPVEVLEKIAKAFNPDQDCTKARIFTREETEKILDDLLESDIIVETTQSDAESLLEHFEPK